MYKVFDGSKRLIHQLNSYKLLGKAPALKKHTIFKKE